MTANANARTREIEGRSIVRGKASGPALVSQVPISFLGDLEITTGRIVGKLPGVEGRNVKGTEQPIAAADDIRVEFEKDGGGRPGGFVVFGTLNGRSARKQLRGPLVFSDHERSADIQILQE